jgi:hypothetical protein
MKRTNNPIVNKVIDKFDSVYIMTKSFVENRDSAIKAILVSGDAGTGKTHWVRKAIEDLKLMPEDVYYVKGASISAAALFVILYIFREAGKLVVLDDCDIIHKSPAEKNAILDMLKGATEVTKGERKLSWIKATPNQLMRENNVPVTFDFQGSIIWITNDTIEDIAKKSKSHWNAISSRFNQIKVYLSTEEKVSYTLHLIENCGMLGKSCQGKEGGYSIKVQNDTIDYINEHWEELSEITPRVATKIADMRENYPSNWKTLVKNQI